MNNIHGVLLNIFDTGVLLRGNEGSGKSTLALALLKRGHQLVADDAPEFSEQNGNLTGSCPNMLSGFLHVRHLGIINIAAILGSKAIKDQVELQLVISLDKYRKPLYPNIPEHYIPAATPHLTTLVETYIQDFKLRQKGYNAAFDLENRQYHECNRSDH